MTLLLRRNRRITASSIPIERKPDRSRDRSRGGGRPAGRVDLAGAARRAIFHGAAFLFAFSLLGEGAGAGERSVVRFAAAITTQAIKREQPKLRWVPRHTSDASSLNRQPQRWTSSSAGRGPLRLTSGIAPATTLAQQDLDSVLQPTPRADPLREQPKPGDGVAKDAADPGVKESARDQIADDAKAEEKDGATQAANCARDMKIYMELWLKEREHCLEGMNEIRGTTILKISVDISPTRPNVEELWKMCSRDWHDKDGKLLFTGKPMNYEVANEMITLVLTGAQTDANGKRWTVARKRLDAIRNKLQKGEATPAELREATRQLVEAEAEFYRSLAGDPKKKVHHDDLSVDDRWHFAELYPLPKPCIVDRGVYKPRDWVAGTMMWTASALCHKPLYFEQPALERYGHSAGGPLLGPLISGGHFFASVPVLPYKMGLKPPNECVYTLGYYRPGSCAPYLLDPLPISVRAGLWQAGALLGGVYIIP